MSPFQEKLVKNGYCDERGAAFCAKATKLPRGEYGIVALCVKGDQLYIFDVDMKSNIKEFLYRVPLKQIEDLKIKTFILNPLLRFSYENNIYSFTNFAKVKPALEVIREESSKK